jgi:hypothetical protein
MSAMQVRDTIFRGQDELPEWAATLYRQIGGGGEEAPPDILTPLAALDEVVATCASLLVGRGDISRDDRWSLARDVSVTLRNLGPATRRSVSAMLQAFQRDEVARLADLLVEVEGARRLAAAAEVVVAELATPAVCAAAWDDAVAAFRDGAGSAECELRIAQLRELCVRTGHSWDAAERRARGILAGDQRAALRVGADAGPPEPLSLEDRLAACRELLGTRPPQREAIVWLVYLYADLPNAFLRLGPVQMFSHGLPLDAIRDGCPALNTPDFERPDELGDALTSVFFDCLPEPPYVLVRVALEPGEQADLGERARDLVSSLVEIARPATEWVLSTGTAIYTEGGWWGSPGFRDPADYERAARGSSPVWEGTGDALAALDERLIHALAEGNPAATAAVAEQRWLDAADAAPDPAQRLALAMRILERALPVPREAGASIRTACERHLLHGWCFATLNDELVDAAHTTFLLPRELPLRDELIAALAADHGGRTYRVDVHRLIERIDDLAAGHVELSMSRRFASEQAAAVATGDAVLERLAAYEAQFKTLMARTVRQRNAVVHGATTVPAVVSTCTSFIRTLAGVVVAQTVAAATRGEDVLTRLEHARAAWLRQREALAHDAAPVDVLFRGDLRASRAD